MPAASEIRSVVMRVKCVSILQILNTGRYEIISLILRQIKNFDNTKLQFVRKHSVKFPIKTLFKVRRPADCTKKINQNFISVNIYK